ncbi:sulfatase [Paraglaciecola sp.]|uniref:sulfatase n=1 Tax=Paraglaciecola sp. TaxID=1920173 RepID=UPI003EF0BA7C
MITRRNFLLGGAGAITAAAFPQQAWLAELKKEYPNVLMLIVDDLNDWVGAMKGHPNAKTPNIDRLANQGTLFTNAHASAPLCGPSRASIMTGLAPSTTGIYGHISDKDIRSAHDKTSQSVFLSEYFKQHGYYTSAIGKVFHQKVVEGSFDVYGGREQGFGPYPEKNMVWDQPKTSTDWGPFPERDDQMPDFHSAHWVAKELEKKHDKPFFTVCGFIRPHVPWHVPQKWFDLHPTQNIVLPPYLKDDLDDVPDIAKIIADHPMMPTTEWAIKNGEFRNAVQGYLASVSFVDSCIGIVLDALENSAYADNTAVVLWGDHGYQVGEKDKFAKMALWERATRTPLIIKPPKSNTKQTSHKPVSLLDLYPTLIKMCGLPPNPNNEGQDLTPLLFDPSAPWAHVAVTTYGANNHAIKTERYRYIQYEDGTEELYDHKIDRDEWTNVANDKAYSQVKNKLASYVPQKNAPWSKMSYYNGNDYFLQKTIEAGAKGRM